MNTKNNKTILRNLVGRLVPTGTVYELPGGILSEDEVKAISYFGDCLYGQSEIDTNDEDLNRSYFDYWPPGD